MFQTTAALCVIKSRSTASHSCTLSTSSHQPAATEVAFPPHCTSTALHCLYNTLSSMRGELDWMTTEQSIARSHPAAGQHLSLTPSRSLLHAVRQVKLVAVVAACSA